MNVSVIIPTLNEAGHIARLIKHLFENAAGCRLELIVVDGGSTDETVSIAGKSAAKLLTVPDKRRAIQMNRGASLASGDVLYFVHADTLPPASFVMDIKKSLAGGFHLGRYRTRFDSSNLLLKLNAFFTRFDWFVCYGGDQTLFITRDLFQEIGGYREDMHLMEEYELVSRARKKAKYAIIPGEALVSARKYADNSWWSVQQANYRVVKMYKRGASQEAMISRYEAMLRR